MISVSRMAGTSVRSVVPSASSAAAISLSTLFFAPLTVTSPASRAPPVTRKRSMRVIVEARTRRGGPDCVTVNLEASTCACPAQEAERRDVDAQAREEFRSYVAGGPPVLLRTARSLTGEPSDAEDLLQTALAKTYLAWERIEDHRAPRRLRPPGPGQHPHLPVAQAAQGRRVRLPTSCRSRGGAGRDPADHDAARRHVARCAAAADRQRAMVVLRYYEDLSEAQTAEVLGVSVGTVKSAVSRALAKLREDSSCSPASRRPPDRPPPALEPPALRAESPHEPPRRRAAHRPAAPRRRGPALARPAGRRRAAGPPDPPQPRRRRGRRLGAGGGRVALAVPLLTGRGGATHHPWRSPRPAARRRPHRPPEPAPSCPARRYELSLASPWAYRGTPLQELGEGLVPTVTREYAAKRGVADDAVTLTPLWGQVWEPSGQAELVFVAVVGGEARWGLARSSEAGPEFAVDEPLPEPPLALAAALPGDEVARLVVVAAPTVGALEYGPDLASEYATMATLAPGVGTRTQRSRATRRRDLPRARPPGQGAAAGRGAAGRRPGR